MIHTACHMDAPGLSALDVSVVLPTFNEAESLPVIVPRIARTLREAGIAGEIVIVDDNSPDGTAAIAEQTRRSYPGRVEMGEDLMLIDIGAEVRVKRPAPAAPPR